MSDNLTVFGTDYTNVTGIKAKGTGNGTLTYVRPQGTKSISANGTGIDVASYASVDVAVEGGPDWPVFTSDDEATTITCDKTYAECKAMIEQGTTGAILETPSYSAPFTAIRVESQDPADTTLRYIYMNNGVPLIQVNYASDGSITKTNNVDTVVNYLIVTENGEYGSGAELFKYFTVDVPSSTPTLQSKSVSYTPTETAQSATVTADSGYDGLSSVDVSVGAISSTYVGSGIDRRSSSDLTVGGATVTAPAGYYASSAQKTIPSGTEGTPTATKGTVSNHSVSITPSVTNSAGYITGSTKTGTAVTVSASELVSGTYTVDSSGTKDVTNYASASVAAGGATASASKGAVSNHSISVTPKVTRTAGYVTAGTANGTAVTVSASELVSGSETKTVNGTYDVTNLASVVVDIPIVTYYTSSSTPTSSQGSDGDIWLVTA